MFNNDMSKLADLHGSNPDRLRLLFQIAYSLDLVMTAFEHDESLIFEGQNAPKEFKFGHLPRDKQVRKIIKQCSVRGCISKPIDASHTIQKAGSLVSIAEDGHLVSPQSGSRLDDDFGEIGINEASTFPGFCELHETMFSRFENEKTFNDEQDFRLQIYRTICRELVSAKILSKKLIYSKKFYKKFRNKKLDDLFEIALSGFDLNLVSAGIKKRRIHLRDEAILFYESELRRLRSYRRQLRKFEDAVLSDINSETNSRFYYDALDLDFEIPVALAGRGGMNFQHKSQKKQIDFIINVIPFNGRTFLLMGSLMAHHKVIEGYLLPFLRSPYSLISLVESWMLYGSDHWFVKSSVWKNLTGLDRKKIYDEMHWSKKNILAKPEIPIFVNTRLELLKLYKKLGDTHHDMYIQSKEYLESIGIVIPEDLN